MTELSHQPYDATCAAHLAGQPVSSTAACSVCSPERFAEQEAIRKGRYGFCEIVDNGGDYHFRPHRCGQPLDDEGCCAWHGWQRDPDTVQVIKPPEPTLSELLGLRSRTNRAINALNDSIDNLIRERSAYVRQLDLINPKILTLQLANRCHHTSEEGCTGHGDF